MGYFIEVTASSKPASNNSLKRRLHDEQKKSNDKDKSLPIQSRFLLYLTEDGKTRIEVRLQDETVWLNQSAMAELFQSTKQNISLYLRNIFNKGELKENRVVKQCLTTAVDGEKGHPTGTDCMQSLLGGR